MPSTNELVGDHLRHTLGADLEAAVVRALRADWERINYCNLRSQLRPPVLLLSDAESRLGQWSRIDRTIEIARRLPLAEPWGVVVEVLKHEMAHQYADEVLGAVDETAHGEAFRRGCRLLGIDPAASGMPRVGAIPDAEARVLARIAKLLALAGSPNQHEAEVAMREAQRLMLKHDIDAAQAGGRRASYGFRHLGAPTGRLQTHQRILANILCRHFFVETIWVTVHRPLDGIRGTVLEVCGSEAHLEMASYVHDFLLHTAERLWREHRRAERIMSDKNRRSFLAGVMRGFDEKLEEERDEQRREGLVLRRDRGLADYFNARYPRRQSMRSPGRAHAESFHAGQAAGRSIVLHKPVGQGGSSGPRLLPPRR